MRSRRPHAPVIHLNTRSPLRAARLAALAVGATVALAPVAPATADAEPWRAVGAAQTQALDGDAVAVTASDAGRTGIRRMLPRLTDVKPGERFRAAVRLRSDRPLRLRLVVREIGDQGRIASTARGVDLVPGRSVTLATQVAATAPDSRFRLVVVGPELTPEDRFTLERLRVRRVPPQQPPVPDPGTGSGGSLQVGTQFHGLWSSYTDEQRQRALDAISDMGAGWVRLDIGWSMLQPRDRNSYDTGWGVPFVDKVIRFAHARGLKVLGTLWLTPQWADPVAGERSAPADPRDYARALAWAADRWKGQVQAWEVWNEPNSDDFFDQGTPQQYTELLCTAYRTVQDRVANPPTIVYGGTVHNDFEWIRRTYDAGVKGCFDAMATHPYVGPADASPSTGGKDHIWDFASVEVVRELMLARGDDKPIWATEFGWSSHGNRGDEPSWSRGVTEAQQADYTVAALRLFRRDHPYVTHAFVYNEREKQTSDPHQNGYGIMRRDLSPKPVYQALRDYLTGD